jgi:hypothetical protein
MAGRRTSWAWLLVPWVLSGAVWGQKHKTEEPVPLPPQPPMALKVDTETLDFHLSTLLRAGGLAAQIRQSLNDLIRDTHGETIVKLRAFVAGAGDARRVQAEATKLFTEHKLPLPVLTVIQVGGLGEEQAKVVIEAVVATRRVVNPNGLAFFAGQTGDSLDAALAKLKQSTEAAAVPAGKVLGVTCFTARLNEFESVRARVQATFTAAQVNLVQAVRDPLGDASTCEAIGQLAKPPVESSVVLLKESRVALVNTKQLVITGLQLSFGSFLDDAHEAFMRLQHSATALDSVEAPLEVNVFSLDPSGGSALRKTTAVPPSTLTVQSIEGLPSVDATAGLEAVLAAGVGAPAAR